MVDNLFKTYKRMKKRIEEMPARVGSKPQFQPVTKPRSGFHADKPTSGYGDQYHPSFKSDGTTPRVPIVRPKGHPETEPRKESPKEYAQRQWKKLSKQRQSLVTGPEHTFPKIHPSLAQDEIPEIKPKRSHIPGVSPLRYDPRRKRMVTQATYAKSDDKKEMSLMKPFAGYKDFDECVRQNQDKDDPKAYCGSIKHRVEDVQKSVLENYQLVKAGPPGPPPFPGAEWHEETHRWRHPDTGKVVPKRPRSTRTATGKTTMDKIRNVKEEGHAKVGDHHVDGYTASAIIAVYDKLNVTNRERFAKLSIPKMADLAFQFVKSDDTMLNNYKAIKKAGPSGPGSGKDIVKNYLLAKEGRPPFEGAVFDRTKHRWVKPTTDTEPAPAERRNFKFSDAIPLRALDHKQLNFSELSQARERANRYSSNVNHFVAERWGDLDEAEQKNVLYLMQHADNQRKRFDKEWHARVAKPESERDKPA